MNTATRKSVILVTLREASDMGLVDWNDYSYHKTWTCLNHRGMSWSSKSPFARSVFIHRTDEEIVRANLKNPKFIGPLTNEVCLGAAFMYGLECDCPSSDWRIEVSNESVLSLVHPDE